MGYAKVKGVVIKEVNTGEADKMLTIFSKENGKISVYAKSARRPKSRFAACSQLFCYADFVLYKGRDIYNISSCEAIETFHGVSNDLEKLTCAAHIVELVNDVIQENQPSARMLQLFLNTLHMLAKSTKPPLLITRIFEIRMISILGYAPHIADCTGCRSQGFDGGVAFSFRKCGFVCGACAASDVSALKISKAAALAMQHVIYSKMKDLFSFELSDDAIAELGMVMRRYLADRLEKDYKKLDFLNGLNT